MRHAARSQANAKFSRVSLFVYFGLDFDFLRALIG